MLTRRRLIMVMAAAGLCPARAASRLTWRGVALGGDVAITLIGERDAARAALAAARAEIERMEALFSLFRPDSALVRLNATGYLVAPAPEFCRLLALCDEVHGVTGGRFDPTVQPLWQALAEGVALSAARARAEPVTGWDKVAWTANAVRLAPGMALTFNGIAQGFATDIVADRLAADGFPAQLVDIGELRAGEGEWRVALSDPEWGDFSHVTLSRTAIATSSPGAMVLPGGQSHILSPRGEEEPLWSSVVVEAQRAGLADGLSTGFCLMSAPQMRAARAMSRAIASVTLVSPKGEIATL